MSMKEIADRVGVSVATVSRVLNDPDHRCSCRDEILQVAQDLNYAPNAAARNLKLGVRDEEDTKFLAILMTRADAAGVDPFFTELIRCVESEIHRTACILTKVVYRSIFSDDRTCDASDVQALVDEVTSADGHKPDGIIIVGKCAPLALEQLSQHIAGIVSINRNSANYLVDEVHCDGRRIAELACEYLIGLGHTQIGYVGALHSETRYEGYEATMKVHGLQIDEESICEVGLSEAEGFEAMEKIMSSPNPPTGIYCANDIIAVGLLKYLWQHRNQGYSPSIIASDDIEESQLTKPMLTTVHLPREEMARFALRLLVDRIDGGHQSVVKLQVEGSLMERCSCSSPEEARD